MQNLTAFESPHFTLQPLARGIHACIHKPGGAAYSNAGIIDLGGRTLVVDAFETLTAGRDLRRAAEALYGRPVDTILLTHAHGDHWAGASAFDPATALLASLKARTACRRQCKQMLQDLGASLEQQQANLESQLRSEKDPRVRAGLEISLLRTRYNLAERHEFRPRCPSQAFKRSRFFTGQERTVEVRCLGRGHSEEDSVLLLPAEGIAFIGDIGFFDSQPFMGACQLEDYRAQMRHFRDAGYRTLVPGHGRVGSGQDLALQLEYVDVLEGLVADVVRRGGTLAEAKQVVLPAPFDAWLFGGMRRFEVNVLTLFRYLEKVHRP